MLILGDVVGVRVAERLVEPVMDIDGVEVGDLIECEGDGEMEVLVDRLVLGVPESEMVAEFETVPLLEIDGVGVSIGIEDCALVVAV